MLEDFLVNKKNYQKEFIKEGSILLFDKPLVWTSFKLVKKVKYLTKAKRVGHAGTLDPLASGLLIIATGKCTKMIEEIQGLVKVYTGTISLGKTTPSFDLETDFDNHFEIDHINNEMIEKTAQSFMGESIQTPPIYSAVKVNGTRAYKLARQGMEAKVKSKNVVITQFETLFEKPDLVHFKIECSKGTYIRTIAHEFGQRLNSGSHLSALRREKIGDFDVQNAFNMDDFLEINKNDNVLAK